MYKREIRFLLFLTADVLPVDMTERKHRVELKSKKENFAESIPMV